MRKFLAPPLEQIMYRLFPGQLATQLVAAEPYENDTFTLEGHEIRIIEQGYTDGPHTSSLYVPSIDLVVAGDVVYNQCHLTGQCFLVFRLFDPIEL
jgi:hypothetical protein